MKNYLKKVLKIRLRQHRIRYDREAFDALLSDFQELWKEAEWYSMSLYEKKERKLYILSQLENYLKGLK